MYLFLLAVQPSQTLTQPLSQSPVLYPPIIIVCAQMKPEITSISVSKTTRTSSIQWQYGVRSDVCVDSVGDMSECTTEYSGLAPPLYSC